MFDGMRVHLFIFWCGLFLLQAPAQRILFVKEDSLPAYPNRVRQMFEKPIFELKAGTQVKMVEEFQGSVKIEAPEGRMGWVKRDGLEKKLESVFSMNELRVFGYLDNIDPVYILDFENDQYKSIRVTKDFVYDPDFMLNIDREEFEWENEVYYYKGQ